MLAAFFGWTIDFCLIRTERKVFMFSGTLWRFGARLWCLFQSSLDDPLPLFAAKFRCYLFGNVIELMPSKFVIHGIQHHADVCFSYPHESNWEIAAINQTLRVDENALEMFFTLAHFTLRHSFAVAKSLWARLRVAEGNSIKFARLLRDFSQNLERENEDRNWLPSEQWRLIKSAINLELPLQLSIFLT